MARKRNNDGTFKRWKPRWFIVVKASEDRAIDPNCRTGKITYTQHYK
jgi:hypothetical protein